MKHKIEKLDNCCRCTRCFKSSGTTEGLAVTKCFGRSMNLKKIPSEIEQVIDMFDFKFSHIKNDFCSEKDWNDICKFIRKVHGKISELVPTK